jgi:hypothetical protein
MAAVRCGCHVAILQMTDDRNLTRTRSRNPVLVILMGVFCEIMARRNEA